MINFNELFSQFNDELNRYTGLILLSYFLNNPWIFLEFPAVTDTISYTHRESESKFKNRFVSLLSTK